MLPVIKMFFQPSINHTPFVGGKHPGALEMKNDLTFQGIEVLKGFVVTADAFKIFLKENKLELALAKILNDLDTQTFSNIVEIARAAIQLVLTNELPHQLEIAIRNAHYTLCGEDTNVSVTIKSSVTSGLPAKGGFTQMLESFENIRGEDALIHAVHKCFTSMFSEKAVYDRYFKKSSSTDTAISIHVEKVTHASHFSSTQIFAIDHLDSFNRIMSFKTAEHV